MKKYLSMMLIVLLFTFSSVSASSNTKEAARGSWEMMPSIGGVNVEFDGTFDGVVFFPMGSDGELSYTGRFSGWVHTDQGMRQGAFIMKIHLPEDGNDKIVWTIHRATGELTGMHGSGEIHLNNGYSGKIFYRWSSPILPPIPAPPSS